MIFIPYLHNYNRTFFSNHNLLFQHLAWQCAGLAAILAWSGALSFVMFFILKKMHILRVSFELEFRGMFAIMLVTNQSN